MPGNLGLPEEKENRKALDEVRDDLTRLERDFTQFFMKAAQTPGVDNVWLHRANMDMAISFMCAGRALGE